ncbi:MAG: hypothetical protein EOM20_04935 [Spartobacteria bacterium]|nr:hypothetical protein [Spartobacteria bacterium]
MSIEAVSAYEAQDRPSAQAVAQADETREKSFQDELAAAMAADHATLEQVTYAALLNPLASSVEVDGAAYGITDIMNLSRSVNGVGGAWSTGASESDMQRGTSEGITYNASGIPLSWPQNDWHPNNRGMEHYDILGGAARVYDFSQSDWDTVAHHRRHNGAWLERFGYHVTEIGDDKLLVIRPQASSDLTTVDADLPVERRTTTQANENVSAYDPPDGPRFLRFY